MEDCYVDFELILPIPEYFFQACFLKMISESSRYTCSQFMQFRTYFSYKYHYSIPNRSIFRKDPPVWVYINHRRILLVLRMLIYLEWLFYQHWRWILRISVPCKAGTYPQSFVKDSMKLYISQIHFLPHVSRYLRYLCKWCSAIKDTFTY